ncbi:unnamed protein product [Hymenolepis diminuta]|uniref:DNA-binding protein n=1 Tax=Hymenolepis diminuta TaxID=6216 RepID=A0A0R3SDA6_HYMDI|nr:unnamed protein product [Hymenolepis diminuta]
MVGMHEFSILLSEERKNVLRRRVKISADENYAETLRSKTDTFASFLVRAKGLESPLVRVLDHQHYPELLGIRDWLLLNSGDSVIFRDLGVDKRLFKLPLDRSDALDTFW